MYSLVDVPRPCETPEERREREVREYEEEMRLYRKRRRWDWLRKGISCAGRAALCLWKVAGWLWRFLVGLSTIVGTLYLFGVFDEICK